MRNQACTYGLARPKGRPRLSHRSPSISPPCSTGLDLNILSTLYDPEPTSEIHLNCFSEDTFTSTANLISPDIKHLGDWQFLDHELNLPFDITAPQPAQSDYPMDSTLGVTSPSQQPSSATLRGPINSSREPPSCTSLILDTLRSLFLPLDFCFRHLTAPRSANLDTALKISNDAIDNLTVVLECDCSVEPFFSTLVAEVIIKILGWYDLIVEDSKYIGSDSGYPLLILDPIKIGNFEPRKGDSRRMVLQVVLKELDRVQTLVGSFADRYCHPNELIYEEENSVGPALEAALRGRLNTIRSQAMQRMAG